MDQPIITKSDADQKDYRAARWSLVGCSVLVFITSVCIMVLELTASRLIAKSVGSSLYTWTSVIGVILAGISIGNFLGGWVADRYDHRRSLAWLFFISSFCCMTIYPLSQMMSVRGRPAWISWQTWVVVIVSSQYLHPSIVLGMISPITASMALKKAQFTGSTVGTVYAWGAMGSIFGTFLAGFYLISTFGTQHIVWMTAGVLALMGVVVANGQGMFRGAMLFGWLQFVMLVGLLASVRSTDVHADETDPSNKGGTKKHWTSELGFELTDWFEWADDVKGKAHELGLQLKLRRDSQHEYNDESDYFYINVADRVEGGDTVRALHLDHLTHSYFNPLKPTALYYLYEQVYAAITERSAESWDRESSVTLPALPQGGGKLPDWARYDAASKRLSIRGAINSAKRQQLLAASPSGYYWQALETLTTEGTDKKSIPTTAPLEALPAGVAIPESLQRKVHFDETLKVLIRHERISPEDRDRLLDLSPDREYRRAIDEMYGQSRKTSTLFIGGGGFVFPRWIESRFPANPLIHVLELDPAVKRAVQREMGLPPDDETSVKTIIGDARNSVDDLLNGLARDPSVTGPHNQYDFVYGDAFNDFSVPWHLTTQEFAEKIKRLLTPNEGIFLVNVIDIYPRAEFPDQIPKGSASIEGIQGPLPSEVWSSGNAPNVWHALKNPTKYGQFEGFRDAGTGTFHLRCLDPLSGTQRENWTTLLSRSTPVQITQPNTKTPQEAIDALEEESNRCPTYNGDLPASLVPEKLIEGRWTRAKVPYDYIELKLQSTPADVKLPTPTSRCYALGLRGVISPAKEKELLELAGNDKQVQDIFRELIKQTRTFKPGRFLGAYVITVCRVFPNVYVFSTTRGLPDAKRDTFVVACSLKPLDFTDLGQSGNFWSTPPFAWMETKASGEVTHTAQMQAILELSRGITLTDDYAPVDNLLIPVFADQ